MVVVKPTDAIDNAARLLQAAEVETNPQLMERLDEMAATWLRMAELLIEHVEAQS